MTTERAVLLAAGGTGGHLFPAQALSEELRRRGIPVELATDERAGKYAGSFPARAIHTIPAATPTGGGFVSKVMAALQLGRGTLTARGVIKRTKPLCIVGFGGYPTVPPVMAATMLNVPSILHEQNAVMGRANRFLAKRVSRIATGFPNMTSPDETIQAKIVHTGNPVRPAVIEAAKIPYPDTSGGRLRVLVTGGSQGARVMADIVPPAIEAMAPEMRARLDVVQQARGEDEARVSDAYKELGLAAEVAPFFSDLPQRMAWAHLVIARSGASTVSELAVIGRPAILVPFPFALDNDQAANAAHLARTGAVEVVRQNDFTVEWLAAALTRMVLRAEGLTARAEAAKSAGVPDAAARLADLVCETAGI
jgi:UDP-N-acetylglucosamine--N-acetylmuramyl-(pentapeptide) pyrophosphoryl-undecaprenol N-acetylglucosamine transferase